jgi:hypothetical protein
VDGLIGPKTIEAARYLASRGKMGAMVQAFRVHAEQRYRAIVAADPSQQRFIRGWTRRARELGRV